jgi:replicative DNA helicase
VAYRKRPQAETPQMLPSSGGRIPPQAVDVEKAVLGAMLIDREAVPKALEVVDDNGFYNPLHQKIFRAMNSLFERSEPIDAVTVTEEMRKLGTLDPSTDPLYLTELTMNVSTAANIEYHARIILEKSLMRSLISASGEIASRAYNETEDALDLLDEAEGKIFQISERRLKKSFTSLGSALADTMETLQALHGTHGGITGVPSGFPKLDEKTGGWQKSDLIIVAGRPSQGKTAFALTVARNAALHKDKKTAVGIFSLEMAEQQLIIRLLAAEAKVNAHELRTGRLHDDKWKNLSRNVGRLAEAKIFIDDTPALSILELRAKARRLKAEHGVGLIIADYLQLIQGPRNAESREREISTISRSLKALAKELNIPVIALSQLNRAVEARTDRRPMLADLRECVTGDTLVCLADGRRVPISELVGREVEVQTMHPDGRIGTALSDAVWRVGRKPVFEIRLASGRSIRATAEHRLYGIDGWIKVRDLQNGSRLAIARRTPEPDSTSAWSDEKLILLGHLMGDGSYLSGQPMRYTTSSIQNSFAVSSSAARAFGVTVKRYAGRNSWHQLLISGNGNRWRPEGVNRWLRELGIFNQRSHEKRVPRELFTLSNKEIALFLKHLWATDGCIHTRTGGSCISYYSTNSHGLAYDVASLLHRFGIVGRISSTRKGSYRPQYHVKITSKAALTTFLQEIGAFGPRILQARGMTEYLSTRSSTTNVDTIPVEVFQQVQGLMQEYGISQREMSQLRGTAYGGSSHYRFAPSREVLLEYAELLHNEDLIAVATSDLFWDSVTAIEPYGEEDVYDLTVPETSSWLADGIVSHNSGAIEQDADVVIFVHRPESYGITEIKDDELGSIPSEGVAEIIIGKQRNGPIDTVRLAFRKEYAGFERLAPVSMETLLPPPVSAGEDMPF